MSTSGPRVEELLRRMRRAREHPEIDEKGNLVPEALTEEQAAARGYDLWKHRGFKKVATPRGLFEDAKGAQRDFFSDPLKFPKRLKDRAAAYDFQGGPDINEPAFTHPIGRSSVSPYRAEGDLIRAERSSRDWRAQSAARPRRKRKVNYR